MLVKHLLYTEKYTIDGARQKVDEHRKAGGLRGAARVALGHESLETIEADLGRLLDLLEGRAVPDSDNGSGADPGEGA
jgi:hypothetical protein